MCRVRLGLAGLGILLCLSATAVANDRALVAVYASYPGVESATAGGDAQDGYEAARNLQEDLRAAWPVSAACRDLYVALGQYANARVLQLEGIDRPSPADTVRGRQLAASAKARLAGARATCRAGPGGGARRPPLALSPASGEVFYGSVVAQMPIGADNAQVFDGRRPGQRLLARGGTVRFDVTSWAIGAHDVRVIFARGNRSIAMVESKGARLLPRSAQRAVPGTRSDGALSSALARSLAGGPSYKAAWVQDLSTGRTAGMNAGALFPAASTVKLGLLVGVLGRLGPRPERSRYAYDLQSMAGWSSNLANNRLVRHFGVGVANDGLRRLGASSSTFTGEYIVGTELQPALPTPPPGASPPRVSQRVTSAQDLGRMLFAIHASAVSASARQETGLTAHQAHMALGWLLTSQQRGDNASLLAGGVPRGGQIAQKNGWLKDARHGAGLIYTARGPAIAVLMTYDERGVSLPSAQALGARVAQLAGP